MRHGSSPGIMETRTVLFPDLVSDGLAAVEARMRAGTDAAHPEFSAAIAHLLSSGGKRLRPTLVLLVGGLLETDPERTITVAAATELLHTATLVHDDLIDGSILRRGFPTLNSELEDGAVILIGDYVFARAAQLAAETESVPLIKRFAETLAVIVNGELTQLLGSSTGDLRTDYFDRVYAKTGSLFELSAESPALLLETAPDFARTLKEFGRQLGVAFQIVDDVLDFTGSAEEVGKPVGNDLRQGLVTLPTIYYLDSRPEQASKVDSLRDRSMSEENAGRLIDDIRESGAVEAALEEAAEYVGACERLVNDLPFEGPRHVALLELARYVLNRTQ